MGEKEEIVKIRSRSRSRDRSPPAFLRPDYGRTAAGPMVLRVREREEVEFAPRRRRSPSPEPERVKEREEIIIRRDESDSRERLPPPAPLPPPPAESREEIIIRRDDRDRDDRYGLRPPPRDFERDREEIIIRRTDDDREPRYERRRDYDDYALARPKSHERERSRIGRGGESDEIIIRRDEREGGRGGDREREEIIIRRNESRSPSPPPFIRPPPIHQEVITHHRHIDHGYETARPGPPSRAPSPPREEERIEIRRQGERNGRPYEEDIIIDRNETSNRALAPYRPPPEPIYEPPPPGRRPLPRDYRDERDFRAEADYYNDAAMARAYPGEAYRGATRDWAIVDVPPGTQRVRMDGVGGGEQEITWQRYNGVRRSQFHPDGDDRDGYGGGQLTRPYPDTGGQLGARYGNPPNAKDRLWTEITKDLVVKEAIKEMGYEFEETEDFYYVFKFLGYVRASPALRLFPSPPTISSSPFPPQPSHPKSHPLTTPPPKQEDVSHLVGLSEDIKKGRHTRIKQIEWENRVEPRPEIIEERRERLLIEPAPGPPLRPPYEFEEDIYRERDVVYRGPGPPVGGRWR